MIFFVFLSPARERPRPTHPGPQGESALCVLGVDLTSDHCHCQVLGPSLDPYHSRTHSSCVHSRAVRHTPVARSSTWVFHVSSFSLGRFLVRGNFEEPSAGIRPLSSIGRYCEVRADCAHSCLARVYPDVLRSVRRMST